LPAAFDELTISRGIMVVEGDYVACQTTITGIFVRKSTSGRARVIWAPSRRILARSSLGVAYWLLISDPLPRNAITRSNN
jgi:hypothetical protein